MRTSENPSFGTDLPIRVAKKLTMNQPSSMTSATEELVRIHRPPSAKFYVLRDGSAVYPTNGYFTIDPFEEPTLVPPGSYQLLYREHQWSTASLPPLDPTQPYPIVRIVGSYGSQTVSGSLPGGVKEEQLAKRNDPLNTHEEHIKNRIQFERVRMFDENITSEHLIGKRLVHNQEIGESFVVAKAWRQENDVLRRNQVKMLEEYMALGRQLAEERLARSSTPRPAESGSVMGGFSKELLSLVAPLLLPAIAKKVGLDGVADAKIADSDDEIEREIAKTKRDLKETQDQVRQSKKAPSQRLHQLEAILASALAELAALKESKPKAAPRKGARTQAKPPKAEASAPSQAKRKSAAPKARRPAKQLPHPKADK